MKDCDGNELAVGDVVEVVKPGPTKQHTGEANVVKIDPDAEALIVSTKIQDGLPDWAGWYPTEQLRLVRRKEHA